MTLSHQEAKSFYDDFGMKQDRQPFEELAIETLLRLGRFDSAENILEFGCGTAKAAINLLTNTLPATATYTGLDASDTMIDISRERLAKFGARASVQQTGGAPRLPFAADTFDRVLSTYVLDLFSDADIELFVTEAWRVLQPNGLLVVTSLTHGRKVVEKLIEGVWMAGFQIRPKLVGGCRPITIKRYINANIGWQIENNEIVSQLGFCSEIMIAKKHP